MNLIYTNYITNYKDLEAEIEFLIMEELIPYKYISLEIVFYIKNEEPKILHVNSFSTFNYYLLYKTFSALDFLENLHEIQKEDIQGILINLYIIG
jgi:hypothetical protein